MNGTTMRPVIVWFRRDLRVDDHAALTHAARIGTPIVPVFIFDTDVIERIPSDGAVFDFQAECLDDLSVAIARLGGTLILRKGRSADVHRELIREFEPSVLLFNRDYEPYARTRDAEVEGLYRKHGVEVQTFKDHVIHEPSEVLTGKGDPYVVFTPYANAWKRLNHPLPFGKPRPFTTPTAASCGVLRASDLKRRVRIPQPAFRGGSIAARSEWKKFLEERLSDYGTDRDIPSTSGTSRMSPFLRFGTISARRLLDDVSARFRTVSEKEKTSIRKFVDELIWREFYQAVLFHRPGLVERSYRVEMERMPWSRSESTFSAWTEGRTGFPMVDAGIRQLRTTGWMHNRVRMVVASFLTKDLLHHWKRGERFFEEYLFDIDTASNNGGWQWSASTGVDPKPLRIFNPTRQAERFDHAGSYIRSYVPELQHVPGRFIHAPHLMPPALQREVGCRISRDYPAPIIDHREASARFKAAYRKVKRSSV